MNELEKPTHIWFEDAVVPWAEARVHVWTETVLRAASVFEGLRGYWSHDEQRHYFVHMDRHLDRLRDSAQVLRLPRTVNRAELMRAVTGLVSTLGYREDVYIRPTLFLREGRYTVNSSRDECGFFMPMFSSPRERSIDDGLTCQVSSWRRSGDTTAPPRVKASANYYNLRLARLEAQSNGYDEAILLNERGFVAETGGASVFVVKNGRVATPSIGSSILDSITRSSVIDLLKDDFGILVEERDVERTELLIADEVFLTGTLAEVTPVVNIDGLRVGEGTPGPLTKRISTAYLRICQAASSGDHSWLTPGPVIVA